MKLSGILIFSSWFFWMSEFPEIPEIHASLCTKKIGAKKSDQNSEIQTWFNTKNKNYIGLKHVAVGFF